MFYIEADGQRQTREAAAMAVMRRELPSGVVRMGHDRHRPTHWWHPVLTALLAVVAIVVVYQLCSGLLFWGQVKLDDLRYGYPRSYSLDGYVGFGEANGQPTHFIALNLHRQVEVLAISGDDPTHIQTIKGPYLFGPGEEFAPVTLRLLDVNGDGYPDLVVSVDHQQLVYIDQPHLSRFRALLPGERTTLLVPSSPTVRSLP